MRSKLIFSSLAVVWMGHLVMDLMLGIFPVYKTLVGMDLAVAGLIMGVSMMIGEATQLLIGYWSDRGFQKYLIVGGLLLGSSIAFLSYSQSSFMIFLVILFLYLGSSAFHPSAIGMVSHWSSDRKGLLVTLFASGGMLGAACSQILFTQTWYFFEGNTLVFLFPGLLVALALFFFPFPNKKSLQKAPSFSEIRSTLMQPQILQLYVTQIFIQALLISTMFLLPDIFVERGYPPWYCYGGGEFLFIFGAGLFSIAGGYLTDRYGHKKVLQIVLQAGALAYLLFTLVGGGGFMFEMVFTFLLGGFLGAMQSLLVAAGTRLVPEERAGIVSGFLLGGASCIGAIGVVLCGFLTRFSAVEAMQIMGIFYLFANIAMLWKAEKRVVSYA